MSSPAIWFDSSETGAPVYNNANGSAVALCLAVLKNGFNVKAITGITVSSGVASVQCPGHGYSGSYGKAVQISGASAAALNGNKQPTIVDANTFTFPAPGVANGSYTATDARRAPLGWVEKYNDGAGTKSIFSRSVAEANAIDLRVNDSGVSPATTSAARVILVKGATGVNTYTSQAPTEAQVAGGFVCSKIANTSSAKPWLAIGTDRDFFLFVSDVGAARFIPAIAFFDGIAFRAGDGSFTCLAGTSGASVSSVSNNLFVSNSLGSLPSTASNGVIFSDETGVSGPEPFAVSSPFKASGGHGDNASTQPTDPLDFAIGFDLYLRGIKAGTRGMVPGNGEPLINASSVTFSGLFFVQDTDDGGKVLLVKNSYTGVNVGLTAFKLSQGWRA